MPTRRPHDAHGGSAEHPSENPGMMESVVELASDCLRELRGVRSLPQRLARLYGLGALPSRRGCDAEFESAQPGSPPLPGMPPGTGRPARGGCTVGFRFRVLPGVLPSGGYDCLGRKRDSRSGGAMAGTKSDQVRPVDERIALGGISLRVLRWQAQPVFDRAEEALPPFLLVHGLASNARLWDGMARRLAQAGQEVGRRWICAATATPTNRTRATTSPRSRRTWRPLDRARSGSTGRSSPASRGARASFSTSQFGRPDLVRGIVLVDGGLTNMKDAFPTWDICWQRLAPPSLVGLPLEAVEGYFRTNHADWPEEGIEGSLGNFEIRPDQTIAPWLTRDRHKAILEAMWDQRTSDLWRDLRVPALIVPVDGGENDWTNAKRAGVESALAAARATGIPVRVEWFRGDHDIHAQRPAELGSAILEAERSGLFALIRVRCAASSREGNRWLTRALPRILTIMGSRRDDADHGPRPPRRSSTDWGRRRAPSCWTRRTASRRTPRHPRVGRSSTSAIRSVGRSRSPRCSPRTWIR